MPRAQRPKAAENDSRLISEEAFFRQAHSVLHELLIQSGLTQRELAQRLALTEGRISQILRGSDKNLTLRTCAALGWAMGGTLKLRASLSGARTMGRDPIDLEQLVANAPTLVNLPSPPQDLEDARRLEVEPGTFVLAA
jgi:transcriptional regulator with XRE-family HTH domain